MSIDRRRHRLFVTRHTEYHLRLDECVGVRDRQSGTWIRDHAALRLRAIRIPPRGHDHAWVGRRLQFLGYDTDVLTTPVVEVARPPKTAPEHYISQECSGMI